METGLQTVNQQRYRRDRSARRRGTGHPQRRKFDEALRSIAKGRASAKNIRKGLDFCNRLFAIEQKLADLPTEERYTQRLEQAKPVLNAASSPL